MGRQTSPSNDSSPMGQRFAGVPTRASSDFGKLFIAMAGGNSNVHKTRSQICARCCACVLCVCFLSIVAILAQGMNKKKSCV